jgi:hypothetical protein
VSAPDGDLPTVAGAPSPELARVRRRALGPRSSTEIRRDIELQRHELARSVEALRGRVRELTDWRRQVREHQRELVIGAAAIGFAVGGLIAMRRARR